MIPEPYFLTDPRNGQLRLRQNHTNGRQVITLKNEIVKGGLIKKGRNVGFSKDSEQTARMKNILTVLDKYEKILAAKGLVNAPLSVIWAEQFKPVDEGAPESNLISAWCLYKASLSNEHYKRGFLNIIAHLNDWGRPNALLVDVNETWVTGYCKYLSTQRTLTRGADENSKAKKKSPEASVKEKGLRTSSINKSVSYLRNVLKSAKKNGQPVGEIPERLKRSTVGGKRSTQRVPLDFGELMKLVALDKLPRHLEIIRAEFVLMSFTGVRIGDLLNPAWLITRDRIINNQGKTAGVHCITLNQYSREIIKRYSTVDLHGNFKLDLPNHEGQYLNRQYKKLARLAGIKKNITNHIARHTFAGILADMNLNESLRSAELGHRANKSVTAGYGIMGADNQVKFVGKKWEKAISLWKGDYETWYEAINS